MKIKNTNMFTYHALIHCVNRPNKLIVETREVLTACSPWRQQSGGESASFYPADMAESSQGSSALHTTSPPS